MAVFKQQNVNNSIEIPIHEASGVYYLEINTNSEQAKFKVIK